MGRREVHPARYLYSKYLTKICFTIEFIFKILCFAGKIETEPQIDDDENEGT